jgi:hypothetical protein
MLPGLGDREVMVMRWITSIKLVPLAAMIAVFMGLAALHGPAATAKTGTAAPPGHGQGLNLVGSVDPHNLPANLPTVHGSKRFLHAPSEEDLARGKTESLDLAPGDGVISSQGSGAASPAASGGFEAINSNETLCGCLPPDGDIAEGNGYLVGAVNTAFEVWNKQGTSLLAATELQLFFYGCNDFITYAYMSDPVIEYDAGAGRFVMAAITFDTSLNQSRLCLAISGTSDPTGNWYIYYLDVTPPASYGSDLLDFPQLAIGSDALYITGNQYVNATTVYAGTRFYAQRKNLLYAGQGDPTGGVYRDIPASNQETAMPVRGVATAKTMYFVAADTVCPCSNASLWEWQDPFGADNLTLNGTLSMLSYEEPPDALQPNGTIVTNDTRVLGAYWTDALGSPTIYAAQTIACNPGSGTVACVHWFQLQNIDGSPNIASQGTIATDGVDNYYPNVAVDKVGHAVIGFASSSSTSYAGLYAYDIDSATETLLKSGNATIDGRRYGDYAGMAVDSADGCTIWHLEEFANGAYLWDTWTSSLVHADCLSGTPPPTSTPTASPTSTNTPGPTPTSTPTPVTSPTSTPTPTATPFCPRGQHKKGTC